VNKKALFVIDRFGSGGAQTQLALLVKGFVERGWNVSVVTYYPNDFLRHRVHLEKVRVIELPGRGPLGVHVIRKLSALLRQEHWAMAVAYLPGPSVYLSIARVIARYRGVVAVGERSSFGDSKVSPRDRITRLAFNFADFVVANSESHAGRLREEFPRLSRKVECIRNAVDVEWFTPAADAPDGGQILCVGRVVRGKNIDGLIHALERLRDRGVTGFRVKWVGRVHDTGYKAECDDLLSQTGLAECWQWVGECEDVRSLYQGASVLALPSLREGFPNVVCEALSCGLPCAISDVGDAAWLTDRGRIGVLFDPNDPSSIAQGLERLLAQPEASMTRMRRDARVFAEREFSIGRLAEQYLALLSRRVGCASAS